jgi:uncharacterized integral membrane protein
VKVEETMTNAFGHPEPKKGMRITWRGIVLIIIGFLLALFAVQNLNTAQVSFLGMDFEIFVWVIVTVSFLLGMLLGGVVRGTARKLRKPKIQS